jgi:glycogen operon protein
MSLNQLLRQAKVAWHGVKLDQPDWSPQSRSIALTAWSIKGRFIIHMMINAYWEELEFEIPSVAALSGEKWMQWIDTFSESPDDISSWDEAVEISDSIYVVQPRSLAVLIARLKNDEQR